MYFYLLFFGIERKACSAVSWRISLFLATRSKRFIFAGMYPRALSSICQIECQGLGIFCAEDAHMMRI